jgi:Na+-driven multidrug efflux pump
MTVVWTAMILDWIIRGAVFRWRFRRLRLTEVQL